MYHEYEEYFRSLEDGLNELYEVARRAKRTGLDPSLEPEPQITKDIAERIEKLIGPPGIGDRMRELDGMDRRAMAFKVAGEIVEGNFGELETVEAADQAIRTALAIVTEGVTVAPIQGIPEIKIKQNLDNTSYLAVYFAGPIRPAGGTAQALTLVVADFVRRKLGLDRFRPSEEAVVGLRAPEPNSGGDGCVHGSFRGLQLQGCYGNRNEPSPRRGPHRGRRRYRGAGP
jgi:DNA polymerase II large subunit